MLLQQCATHTVDTRHIHTFSPCSHFQLVVVRLSCPPSNIVSDPDEMFPHGSSFALYNDHSIGQAYIAAEIDADKLNALLSTPFVIGDESHAVAQMNDVAEYRNGPLAPQACYTFFMRGFLSVPTVSSAADMCNGNNVYFILKIVAVCFSLVHTRVV